MSASPLEDLIEPYLAGELSQEKAAEVKAYLEASPGRRGVMAGIRAAARGDDVAAPPSVDTMHAQLMARIDAVRPLSRIANTTPRRAGRAWIAAGAAMALALAIGLTQLGHTRKSQEMTRKYVTAANQTADLTLSDGTHVTLAPKSTLRLIKFGASSRIVAVDGEAYFDVVHSAGAPFMVQSGVVTTRVLGTAFLVRTGDAGRRVHVAVTHGKISLYGPSLRSAGLMLTTGYIGEVTDSTVHITTVDESSLETEGRNDEFVFHNTPLPKILETLTHWYGYQFRCLDTTLTQQRLTVVVSTHSSAEALAALAQVLDVNVKVVGDTVTMAPQSFPGSRQTPKMSRPHSYDVWMPKTEVGR
jgi:ferric-dicitrate binding protein FerR (iron transport regulator)